jgi:phosphoadenosine phosphosulfate reductase
MEFTEDKSIAFQGLEKKAEQSIRVILETEKRFGRENIAVAFTGGKDSSTLLHLVKTAYNGTVPFKVFNIDTSLKFKEIYEIRDRIAREWNLDMVILRHENPRKVLEEVKDSAECCSLLKSGVLNEGIKKHNIKALMTAIRWDEQEARADEQYFSERPDHTRVHPILHFMEKDIWEYIKKHTIPYCELYNKGYRSLGCEPCTEPSDEHGPERAGRSLDKESIMKSLREMGYF